MMCSPSGSPSTHTLVPDPTLGRSQTALHLTDPTWIVRRTVIDVIRPVVWPDHVHLERWCSSMSTRWTNMRTRITSERGGLIETEGFWINLSESSRAEERRVGKGWVGTCGARWSPYH